MRLPHTSIYVPYTVAMGYGATVGLPTEEAAHELLGLFAGRDVREAADSVAAAVGLDEGLLDSAARDYVRVRAGGWDRVAVVRQVSPEIVAIEEVFTRPNNHRGARRDNRGRRR